MGSAKREMERQESQRTIAIGLLLETRALGKCDVHDEVYDRLGGYEDAKELGRERFESGVDGYSVFAVAEEVEQAVDDARNDHGTECSTCAKNSSDD